MIALELSAEQCAAVEAPFNGCFAIVGSPGTGKTTALQARIARARSLDTGAEPLVVASHGSLARYAVELLDARGRAVTLVDDTDALAMLTTASEPLFAMQWGAFAQEQLDPEVSGLRSPERFVQSAFRLIRRLRDADVGPDDLLARSLAGATDFYANPPNLADPRLLAATKNAYHDSLAAGGEELTRQYRREVDLAKILAKMYEDYIGLVTATGRMTARDAIVAARAAIRDDAALAADLRERHRFAFIDDAERLTGAEVHFLRAIFGAGLPGVTFCGNPSPAIFTDRFTLPDETFGGATARVELHTQQRPRPTIETHRAPTIEEEAGYIAACVRTWLDEGTPPHRIAVLFRSVRCAQAYEAALLERDIAPAIAGDANVFADRRALDALALLWNVYDPFRHDWLLRTLANPALGLSDASLAILCTEPSDPQRTLFALDDEPAPTTRPSRWDPKRDLRLGWNVVRGERDDALGSEAAARLIRFRSQRERWLEAMHAQPFEAFARLVWREGLAREGAPGSAKARVQQRVLERLLAHARALLARDAEATIADVLEDAERRAHGDLEMCLPFDSAQGDKGGGDNLGFVVLASVEAVYGREFDRVVIGGARAGTFPLWYVPDTFLFSPRLGMIPKDNAGDARASRTAKFSYYMFKGKGRDSYNARERRAFGYALARARERVLVTASGTATRGVAAPEFLEELRR